jgi:hypothetical protein
MQDAMPHELGMNVIYGNGNTDIAKILKATEAKG